MRQKILAVLVTGLVLVLTGYPDSQEPAQPSEQGTAGTPPATVQRSAAAPQPDVDSSQYIPLPGYWLGPYATVGSSVFGGYSDYLNLLNIRDGGINGVRLSYSACETEFRVYRAVACYEKLKKNGPTGAALFSFVSTAATYALLEQGNKDKIPIVALGDGRSDTADGRVFPYGFTLLASPWSQSTAEIRFIALQEQCLYQYPELRDKRNRAVKCYRYLQDGSLKEDGLDKLVNRKIANLYLDDAYGRETLPILEVQANRYGFTLVSIPIPPPGIEQETAWQQVATEKPAWILLRGWGVMTPIALKQAARNGFPRYQIIGSVWSGAEEDTVPAGTAAMGFIAASLHATGDTLPAILQIRKLLYRNGKGALQDSNRVGTVLYNQGIIYSLLSTEAIRTAQVEFGHKPLTGEQIRWGLENLQITAQRLAELGLEGLIPPFWTGCKDHEGGAPVHFQQWDGKQWVLVSDWVRTDQSLVRSLVEKSAAAYARGKATPLRDCSIEGS